MLRVQSEQSVSLVQLAAPALYPFFFFLFPRVEALLLHPASQLASTGVLSLSTLPQHSGFEWKQEQTHRRARTGTLQLGVHTVDAVM